MVFVWCCWCCFFAVFTNNFTQFRKNPKPTNTHQHPTHPPQEMHFSVVLWRVKVDAGACERHRKLLLGELVQVQVLAGEDVG